MDWVFLAPIAAVVSILFGGYLFYRVYQAPTGTEKAVRVSRAIAEGANAYLKILYTALVVVALVFSIVLLFLFNIWTAVAAYVFGAACSALAGFFGMQVALMANAKSATAAKDGLSAAFSVAFNAGGVMGMAVVGLAVLGMSVIYMIFRDPEIVLGFSFGASSLALLAKAGGGIYTKTADIGADLVGKVELTLPEDDPRNPAVIADNVGDNVGDVAGMGGDIFDSYVASVVAVMILGASLMAKNPQYGIGYVTLPIVFAAAGVLASIVGMSFVRTGEGQNPTRALNRGTYATCAVFAVLSLGVVRLLGVNMAAFWANLAGLIAGIVIGMTTDYYTSIDQQAVKKTAEASQTGTAINILTGFSYGLLSIVPPIIGIAAATMIAYFVSEGMGMSGLYGISISAVGMLSITGMIVSSDAYGPIVDNAQGVAEMSGMDPEVIHVCAQMDAAGNTAKAITKGFAIGAAGLTVLALFAAYVETVGVTALDLLNPVVIVGVFLGAMMPPVFSAMTILSVGKNAFKMIEEIRRQVREIPGLLEGTADPDYASCVRIASQGALWELIGPGLLAFLSPLAVGFILGPQALGGFLGGSIFVGLIFALFMSNSGGLWDNAKKYIEDGALGGPGSEEHKAAVVGPARRSIP